MAVRSTTDTSFTGTRKDMPVSLPFSSGMALPTALAAPVVEGIMLLNTERPVRRSRLPARESTAFCLAVAECMVDISPRSMPKRSFTTLARGAKQLVVQEAAEMTVLAGSYSSWFTPKTKVGVTSSFAGAVIMIFLAPPFMWAEEAAVVLNAPVDSMIYSAPQELHSILAGSLSLNILTGLPLTIRCWLPASIVPGKWPCTESYRAVYAIYSILRLRRFMPQSSNLSGFWEMILNTVRPILPKPLMPTLIAIFSSKSL